MEASQAYELLGVGSATSRIEIEAAYRAKLADIELAIQEAPQGESGGLGKQLLSLQDAHRVAIASATGEETFDQCAEVLRSDDVRLRQAAFERLCTFNDRRIVKVLEALIGDSDPILNRRAREEWVLHTGAAIAQKGASVELGQIGVLGAYGTAWRMLRSKPATMLKVTLFNVIIVIMMMVCVGLIFVPVGVASMLGGAVLGKEAATTAGMFIAVIVVVLFAQLPCFLSGLIAWAVGRIHLELPVTFEGAFEFACARLWPLMCTVTARTVLILKPGVLWGVLAGLCVGIGLPALALLPGLAGLASMLLALLRTCYADVACVVEGLSGYAACARARELWTAHSGSIFGLALLTWVVNALGQGAGELMMRISLAGIIPALAIQWFLIPVWAALAQVVLYYDLCARKSH